MNFRNVAVYSAINLIVSSILLAIVVSVGFIGILNGHVIFTDGHPVDYQIKSAGCVSTEQQWSMLYPEKNFRILGFKADLYRCQFQDQMTYELNTQGYYLVVFK